MLPAALAGVLWANHPWLKLEETVCRWYYSEGSSSPSVPGEVVCVCVGQRMQATRGNGFALHRERVEYYTPVAFPPVAVMILDIYNPYKIF